MVVNGLSKGVGAESTKALSILAQTVIDRRQELGQWTALHLAMVVNGLSKGEGAEITGTLNVLAQVVTDQRHTLSQWTEQQLAMVVGGLSKGAGEQVTRALCVLAEAVIHRKQGLSQWTEQQLAMVVGGLSKGAGEQITRALTALAQAVIYRKQELNRWQEQHLATLVCGFGRRGGVEAEITQCLQVLAQDVMGRDLGQWTDHSFAMVSSGIGEGAGVEVAQCLERLALEIAVRDLSQWTPQTLAMTTTGVGRIPKNPVFPQLIAALINQTTQEPRWLLIALKHLCRLQLSREQVDAALSLLDALHRFEYRPNGQEDQNELLWCLALVHFRAQQLLAAADSPLGLRDRLAQLYHHSIAMGWVESNDTAAQKAYGAGHHVKRDGDKRWHSRFARDYWQREHPQQGEGLLVRPLESFSGDHQPAPSQLQFNIYGAIKTALGEASISGQKLSDKTIEMEVSINDFPVDILIDKRICIEVDGPSHYLQPERNPDPQSRITPAEHGDSAVSILPSLPGERRAKDRFIDHMLEQYGYRVFRIPYTYRPESLELRGIVNQIQASLADQN